jgi:hypothetical protein
MHEVCHLTHQELFFLNFGSFLVCKLDSISLILDVFSYIFSLSWILHWGFCALIALSTMKCRMMYYLWSFCNCWVCLSVLSNGENWMCPFLCCQY